MLGQILAGTEGFVHVGELNHLWEHNLLGLRPCGCGRVFAECSFWNAVLDHAFGGASEALARSMVAAQRSIRTRNTAQMLRPGTRTRIVGRMAGYLASMSALYDAIAAVSGAAIVVDSSKHPSFGFLMAQAPGVDLRALHLVRDPRASAYSWLRRSHAALAAAHPGEPPLPRVAPARAALTWCTWNAATEWMWRGSGDRKLLRYEEFAADPQTCMRQVVAFAGLPGATLPFVSDRAVELEASHTAAGNPMRFETGVVDIEPCNDWVEGFARGPFATVTALSLPLLHRYGYRMRRGVQPEASLRQSVR